MKTIVLAYHNIGCSGIEKLLAHGFDIRAVFTHRDDPDETLWFSSVAETAAAKDLPVYAPDNINHPLWVKMISDIAPEFIFSLYYRQMVGPAILDIPSRGCLNLHGSLLPKYRGRCPVNWVLVNGERKTGVTLHHMTPKPDNGDIVGWRQVEISENETALTLHQKLNAAAGRLLDELLPPLKQGTAPRLPQDHRRATYYGGRTPADGEIDWRRDAETVRNLVRAVTRPYPGAFSYLERRKCLFWSVTVRPGVAGMSPGRILSADPLVIACGRDAVRIDTAQPADGLFMTGKQLGKELKLAPGMQFGPENRSRAHRKQRKKRVLILGVNGFIGNHLSERLLDSGRYEVHGLDLDTGSIRRLLDRPGFHFSEGDIAIHREWIEYHVRKCDIVLPLVAIATPAEYVRNPLRVFELDFEENLRIVRYCVSYGKRIIFPSTSEVYGMCSEETFDEENSRLVLGPIRKQRWIYSCCKQLLDRVIWAYGAGRDLQFTLFRPFNWIGPRLDNLESARIGSSRVITQLILNLVEGTPIRLVDGGDQKRCFTDVQDGVECLFRIIENKDGRCDGRIFNIGNPDNEFSIRSLAELLMTAFQEHPLRDNFPPLAGISPIESRVFYGPGYEDVMHRRPAIHLAKNILGWEPLVPFGDSLTRTLDFFLRQAIEYAGEKAAAGAARKKAVEMRTL